MATSTIKPVHAGIQVSFTIATSSWATTSPYTYTWTDSRVTAGCRVEVAFDSSSTDASVEYISFEKVSGGIKFTAPSIPTASIAVVVTLVNAQTGNVQAIQASDVSISNTGISGATNVNEALTSLNEQMGNKVNTSAIANNLTTTAEGYVLDARQGKTLNSRFSWTQAMTGVNNTVRSYTLPSNATEVLIAVCLTDEDGGYFRTIIIPRGMLASSLRCVYLPCYQNPATDKCYMRISLTEVALGYNSYNGADKTSTTRYWVFTR